MSDNTLTLVRGILFEYMGNRLTRKIINEASEKISKAISRKDLDESIPYKKDKPDETRVYKDEKGRKSVVFEPGKEKPKDSEYKTKFIEATPGFGETDPNNPHEVVPVAPVTYKTKK